MFCTKCGQEILDEAVMCVHCGCPTSAMAKTRQEDDSSSIGFGILGFFVPMVGLILYLIWQNEYPLRAKSAGKGALISTILTVVFFVLYFVFFIVMMGSLAASGVLNH